MDYISTENFSAITPEEQDQLMRQYIMEMSVEDRMIVKMLMEIVKAETP